MKDIDEKIRSALQEEDRELFDKYAGELSMKDQLIQSFKGRSNVLVIGGMVLGFVFTGFGIYFGMQYFKSDLINDRLTWAVGFITAMTMVSMMKIWYWMELNRLSISREIKRLELQMTQISKHSKQ